MNYTSDSRDTIQPEVSAVICTRNRGASAVAAIESVLANTHPNFEILLVDQSTDDCTEKASQPFLSQPNFRYIRTDSVGAGKARQIALQEARGEIVAYTDDDCTVPPDWLDVIEDIFAKDAAIGVVFCSVERAPHDATTGSIPSHAYEKSNTKNTIQDYFRSIGMGAGMSVRRTAILAFGWFDGSLGPGSHFYSGEDHDDALRALLNDWAIHETPNVAVIHDGFRTFEEFRKLVRRDVMALGAVHAKFVKCGHWSILLLVAYSTLVRGLWQPLTSIRIGKRLQGFRRFIHYWEGFIAGLQYAVDCEFVKFRPKEPTKDGHLPLT